MSLEFHCAAIANGRLPHSGPQAAVHMALTGSFSMVDAADVFSLLSQTGENLRNELAATRCL